MAVAYFKGNIGEVWYIVGIKDVLLWARKDPPNELMLNNYTVHLYIYGMVRENMQPFG